jgi:hypothetical protein
MKTRILFILLFGLLLMAGCADVDSEYTSFHAQLNFTIEYDYIADTTYSTLTADIQEKTETEGRNGNRTDYREIDYADVTYNDSLMAYNRENFINVYSLNPGNAFLEEEEYRFQASINVETTIVRNGTTLGINPQGGPTADTLLGRENVEINFDSDRSDFTTQLIAQFYDENDRLLESASSLTTDANMITLTLPIVDDARTVKLIMKCEYSSGTIIDNQFSETYNYRYFAVYDYLPE